MWKDRTQKQEHCHSPRLSSLYRMEAAADPTCGLAAPGAAAPAELYTLYAPLWAEEEADRAPRWAAFLADLAGEGDEGGAEVGTTTTEEGEDDG